MLDIRHIVGERFVYGKQHQVRDEYYSQMFFCLKSLLGVYFTWPYFQSRIEIIEIHCGN